MTEVEELIVAQCVRREVDGWTITRYETLNKKKCCPIGAFAEDEVLDPDMDSVEFAIMLADTHLGWDRDEAEAFMAGVDNDAPDPDGVAEEFYALGQRVALRVIHDE